MSEEAMARGVQPKLEWNVNGFSGPNSKIDDNMIEDHMAVDCQNVVTTTVGSLTKRKGQEALNPAALPSQVSGLYAYYTPGDNRYLVAASDGDIYFWDGEGFVSIGLILDANAPVFFETTVNYLVIFNGKDSPKKWNGLDPAEDLNVPEDIEGASYPVLHNERLFVVPEDNPSALYFSEPFLIEEWPATNFLDFGKGDGDEITAVVSYLGNLTVFKRYSVWELAGVSMDDFSISQTESRIGAIGPRAVARYGMHLYFVGHDGIYHWNGHKAENLTDIAIPKAWREVNQEHLHKAVAVAYDGYLWFALPEGASSDNNMVLAYDITMQHWYIWRGIDAGCFMVFNDGTGEALYSGGYNGVVAQQGVGYEDFGSPIEAYWETKHFDGGASERVKKFKRLLLKDMPDVNNVNVEHRSDYGAWLPATLAVSSYSTRRFRLTAKCRYLQLRFSHNEPGNFKMRGFMAQFRAKRAR